MKDILKDLQDEMDDMSDMSKTSHLNYHRYGLLFRAYGEIERLRKSNSDMGWELNPDRMGGQFTEEEKNRSGWL